MVIFSSSVLALYSVFSVSLVLCVMRAVVSRDSSWVKYVVTWHSSEFIIPPPPTPRCVVSKLHLLPPFISLLNQSEIISGGFTGLVSVSDSLWVCYKPVCCSLIHPSILLLAYLRAWWAHSCQPPDRSLANRSFKQFTWFSSCRGQPIMKCLNGARTSLGDGGGTGVLTTARNSVQSRNSTFRRCCRWYKELVCTFIYTDC